MAFKKKIYYSYFHAFYHRIHIFKKKLRLVYWNYQTTLIFPFVSLSYHSLRFDSILFRSQPQWCTTRATRESNSFSFISFPTFFQPWFRKSSVQFSVVWLWLWFFRKSGKDFSTAILERKKLPNWLVVDEAVYDDNSFVALHPDTIQKLQLFRGDTILIKVSDLRDFCF